MKNRKGIIKMNPVVVDGSGTDMIDNSVSKTLLNASDSITVQSNGTKWVII